MKKSSKYIQFIFSMMLLGLGISLVTTANLGTSAISSIPYVLSKVFKLSFGTFTALLNIVFITIQIIVLNKSFPKIQYLQIAVVPLLAIIIDLSMYLLSGLNITTYIMKLLLLLFGCIVIGLSITVQLDANVVKNPSEGIVNLISKKFDYKFSNTKILFDVFMVFVAIIISLIGLGYILGIREGTIISAFAVGYVVKIIDNHTMLFK